MIRKVFLLVLLHNHVLGADDNGGILKGAGIATFGIVGGVILFGSYKIFNFYGRKAQIRNFLLDENDEELEEMQISQDEAEDFFFWALGNGLYRMVRFFLTKYPELINKQNKEGNTLMHIAVEFDDSRLFNIGLDYKARMDIANLKNETALQLLDNLRRASLKNILEIAKSGKNRTFIRTLDTVKSTDGVNIFDDEEGPKKIVKKQNVGQLRKVPLNKKANSTGKNKNSVVQISHDRSQVVGKKIQKSVSSKKKKAPIKKQ